MADIEIDLSDLSKIDPKQFAQLIKTTPDTRIKEVMTGDHRDKILTAVFEQMESLFRPEKAGKTNAVIHWNVGYRPDGGFDTYEVVIDNGTCTVNKEPEHEPRVAMTLGAVEFLKIVSGNGNPVMMFMTGKVKAKGDLGLASNMTNFFDLPKA